MKTAIYIVAVATSLILCAMLVAQESAPNSTLAVEIENLEKEVASLSGEEKLSRATERVTEMKASLASANELLEKVRSEEQDILKLNCINEKLAAMKGFLKVSEQSFDSLRAAVTSNDKEAENHHYTLVAIAGQKVAGLDEETQVCAGEVLRFSEETVVDREIDSDIAEVDPIVIDNRDAIFATLMERLPELTAFD